MSKKKYHGTQYLSRFQKSSLLLLFSLGFVLGKKGEQSSGLILGKRSAELIDRRRDLQSCHQQLSLTLDSYVSGPSDESAEIFLRSNTSTDSRVSLGGREPVYCIRKCVCVIVNVLYVFLSIKSFGQTIDKRGMHFRRDKSNASRRERERESKNAITYMGSALSSAA